LERIVRVSSEFLDLKSVALVVTPDTPIVVGGTLVFRGVLNGVTLDAVIAPV
jgi:hypothetical protein